VFQSCLWTRLEDIVFGDDAIPFVLEQPQDKVDSYLLELVQPVWLKMPSIPKLPLDKVSLTYKVHVKEYFPSQSDWDVTVLEFYLKSASQRVVK